MDVFMRSAVSHYGRLLLLLLLLPVTLRPSVCGTCRNIHQMPNGEKQGPGHVFHPSGTWFRPRFLHLLDRISNRLIRNELVLIFYMPLEHLDFNLVNTPPRLLLLGLTKGKISVSEFVLL